METKIIDGKQIASDVRADVAKKVAEHFKVDYSAVCKGRFPLFGCNFGW